MRESGRSTANIYKISRYSVLIILAAVLLLFITTSVSASKERIYDDYIDIGSSIPIGNYNFYISSSDNNSIYIKGTKSSRITLNECESIDNVEFCYLAKIGNQVKLQISYLLPDINIERTMDTDSLIFGKKSQIDIHIENSGDYFASVFTYVETFPAQIEIESVTGDCRRNGSTIIYKATKFDTDDEADCTVELKPLGVFDFALTAKYTYYDGNKDTEKYTGKLSLKSKPGITFADVLKNEADVGDEFEYSLEIVNDNDVDFNTVLEISIPDGFVRISGKGDKFENRTIISENSRSITLLKNITVYKGTTKTITATFKSVKPGNLDLFRKAYLYAKDDDGKKLEFFDSNQKRINVKRVDLELESNFLSDEEIVESGQTIILNFYLNNKNDALSFQNINISFSNGLFFIENNYFESIAPLTKKKILSRAFVIPDIATQTKYPLKIEVRYSTKYNEKLTKTITKYITVKPKGTFTIKHELSTKDKNINPFSENTIITKIKNTRNEDFEKICITENLTGINLTKGMKSICFSIKKNEEKSVLRYSVKANNRISATITTTVDIKQKVTNTSKKDTWKTSESLNSSESFKIAETLTQNLNLKGVITLDKTDIYIGDFISVSLGITNDNTYPLENITIEIPMNPLLDYMSILPMKIQRINPGETIKNEIFKFRPKKIGTTNINEVTVLFKKSAEEGKFYSKTNKITISPKTAQLDTPVVIVTRNYTQKTSNDSRRKGFLRYSLENIGKDAAEVDLIDNSTRTIKYFIIYPDEKKIFEKNITFIGEDEEIYSMNASYATIYYAAKGFTLASSSNSILLKRTDKANVKKDNTSTILPIKNITKNEKNDTTEIKTNTTEKNNTPIEEHKDKPIIDNKKKNVFMDIIEKIIALFSIKPEME